MNTKIFHDPLVAELRQHMPEFAREHVTTLLRVLSPHLTAQSCRQRANQFSSNRIPLTKREAETVTCGLANPDTFIPVLREAVRIHYEYYGAHRNRDATVKPPYPTYECP